MIIVVSGLPRSGTSMMMRMLVAGGLPALTDGLRVADPDNPRGYFEYEPVKETADDSAWVRGARGKVVKVVALLLEHLPADETYRVLFMRRAIDEVLASQRRMLERAGRPTDAAADRVLGGQFERHVERVLHAAAARPELEVLELDFAAVVADPAAASERANAFLGGTLDVRQMAAAVDPELYRQRR